jgi:hypothetical protein
MKNVNVPLALAIALLALIAAFGTATLIWFKLNHPGM